MGECMSECVKPTTSGLSKEYPDQKSRIKALNTL